eukprot:gene56829-biopygen76114
MQENMKTAAKKDQRFLSEAVKGEYRMQSKIYALKDADGNLQTNKSGVHKVLVDEWTKIFTGNASQMSDEFNDKFLQAVEKIDPEKRAQIDADITTEEVMDTLRLLNKNAAATEDEFDALARRPIVIGQLIGKCLTRILDNRLRAVLPQLFEQGGFRKDMSAEDISTVFRIMYEQMTRQHEDLNIFITDWQRMYDSIPIWLPIELLGRQG